MNELFHYNKNHDKLGRFTFSRFGRSGKKVNLKSVNAKVENEKEKRKLSDKQKNLIKIGAIAAASGLAIAGGVYLYKTGALDNLISSGKNTVENIANQPLRPDILGADEKAFRLTSENACSCAMNINPSGSRTNCGSVSSAVLQNAIHGDGKYQALSEVPNHMRIKLNDGSLGNGYDPQKLIECYEGAKWSDKITSNLGSRKEMTRLLEQNLLAQGDGAKGIFYCEKLRNKNFGHYFTYAIIDKTVHVLEGQPPSAQSSGIDWHSNLYEEIGRNFDPQDGNCGVFFARLDNCSVKKDRAKDLFIKRI